jgi:hypothetical protein
MTIKITAKFEVEQLKKGKVSNGERTRFLILDKTFWDSVWSAETYNKTIKKSALPRSFFQWKNSIHETCREVLEKDNFGKLFIR